MIGSGLGTVTRKENRDNGCLCRNDLRQRSQKTCLPHVTLHSPFLPIHNPGSPSAQFPVHTMGNSFKLAFRITGFRMPFSCVRLLCWFAHIPPTPLLFKDLHAPFCPNYTLPPLVCPPHGYPIAFSTGLPLKPLPPPHWLCSSFLTSTHTFSHPNAHTFNN